MKCKNFDKLKFKYLKYLFILYMNILAKMEIIVNESKEIRNKRERILKFIDD